MYVYLQGENVKKCNRYLISISLIHVLYRHEFRGIIVKSKVYLSAIRSLLELGNNVRHFVLSPVLNDYKCFVLY